MRMLAIALGILGGLSGIMGILDAADIIPRDSGLATVDWVFWLLLAAVLLLGAIFLRLPGGADRD